MIHIRSRVLLAAVILFSSLILTGVSWAEGDVLVLPSGLKLIESEAFACASVNTVVFPDGIEFIAEDVFSGFTAGTGYGSLENTVATTWCKEHGWMFADVSASTVIFPDGIESIAGDAFSGFTSGTGYGSLENTVATTWCKEHGWAFADISASTVIFPDGIEFIAADAFSDISSGIGIGSAENTVAIEWCADHGWTYRAYPRYFALIIGNWDYRYLSKLKGIDSDVRAMQNAMGDFSQNWLITVENNLSGDGILSSVRSTFSRATRETDICLLYYSGHGDDSTTATAGSLMGTDTTVSNNTAVSGHVLPSVLCSTIDSTTPGEVIVILDSCGSGASIYEEEQSRTKSGSGSRGGFTRAVIRAFRGKTVQNGAKTGEMRNKYTVLAACEYGMTSQSDYIDQQSLEEFLDTNPDFDEDKLFRAGSTFTFALVRTMGCSYPSGTYSGTMPADNNRDGKLSLTETYLGIKTRVNEMNAYFREAYKACFPEIPDEEIPDYYNQEVQMSGPGDYVIFDRTGVR